MSGNTGESIITLSSYPRAIAHIDCDAFFASCEQAQQPYLKGRPLVTGKERGIISSASYEAKACGIKRGVRLSEARRICPKLVVVPSDYETYSLYSRRMFEIIKRFTPAVEEFSIDEAFCDITGLRRIYRSSYPAILRMIKDAIHRELNITVSAGLSLTKALAKICSKRDKPDGFTVLPGYLLHEFLRSVPLDAVCGFGPNTVELLSKLGLTSALDYIRRPLAFASRHLGKAGAELWRELRGESVYPVTAGKREKHLSISKTKTFMPPSGQEEIVKAQLMKNVESACIKLRRHKLSAAVLTVYLKRADFSGSALQAKLSRHTSSTLDFSPLAGRLFASLFAEGVSYRATGAVLSDVLPEGHDNRTLFDDPVKIKELRELSRSIDAVNGKHGKHTLHLAASHHAMNGRDHPRNNPSRRKKELLRGETFRRRVNIPLLRF